MKPAVCAAAVTLAALAGCGTTIIDPCAHVQGTCIDLQLEGDGAVARVDSVALHITADGVPTERTATRGKTLELPVAVAIVFDALAAGQQSDVRIDAEAQLGGNLVGAGSTSTLLAGGAHTRLHLRLGPSGADLAVEEDLAGADLIGADLAGADLTVGPDLATPCVQASCFGQQYQCGNCADDEPDTLIDSADPECLGPCNNNEKGFFPNIVGIIPGACTVDCYFDGDNGSGNDGCQWSLSCDQKTPVAACAYNAGTTVGGKTCAQLEASQSTNCTTTTCGPLVPNGCDCFGCCQNPAAPGSYVYLGSVDGAGNGTCDAKSLGDPGKCHPCTPVSGCLKPCGTCQICFGKPTLPASCGGQQDCTAGHARCGQPGQAPCASGEYCISGCCQTTQ